MFLDDLNAASRYMLLDLEKLIVQNEMAKLAIIRNGEILDPEDERVEYFINRIDKLEDEQRDLYNFDAYYDAPEIEDLIEDEAEKLLQQQDIKKEVFSFIVENNIDTSYMDDELMVSVLVANQNTRAILLSVVGTIIVNFYCNQPDLYNLSLQKQKMILFEIFKLQTLFNNSNKFGIVENIARAYQSKSAIDNEYFEEIKTVALRPMKDIYDIINE